MLAPVLRLWYVTFDNLIWYDLQSKRKNVTYNKFKKTGLDTQGVRNFPPPKQPTCTYHSVSVHASGILKKKQLSPIAERNGINRIHNELSVSAADPASSRGSSSSEGRGIGAKASVPEQLNGVALSIKAKTGTMDDDSSGSE